LGFHQQNILEYSSSQFNEEMTGENTIYHDARDAVLRWKGEEKNKK